MFYFFLLQDHPHKLLVSFSSRFIVPFQLTNPNFIKTLHLATTVPNQSFHSNFPLFIKSQNR